MQRSVPLAGVILAAGKGTRMKSDLPKSLHSVCGLPIAEHIGRAMRSIGIRRPVFVIGFGGELMRASLGEEHYAYATQQEQLGTGHALLMAREMLASHQGPLLVVPGDAPLAEPEQLDSLVDYHLKSGATVTIGTMFLDDPRGHGRLIRKPDGTIERIIEDRLLTDEQRAIREVNSSFYCFDSSALFEALPKIGRVNAQGEYFLTDVIAALSGSGCRIESFRFVEQELFTGINDRWQLAEAGAIMRKQILRRHALNGVTIVDPATTFIGADVHIEPDTSIEPMTLIDGKTTIASGCVIGPCCRILDATIDEEVVIYMSHVNSAKIDRGARIGPYAHLRPKAHIGERAKIGNFVEIKNATIGNRVSAGHLAYIGDADVGAGTNIGAGTITCNYDGFRKHRTTIGQEAFIGSNSTLVAPITIAEGAYVAAGSTITSDVPAEALGIGRGRQENKDGWAARWKEKNRTES